MPECYFALNRFLVKKNEKRTVVFVDFGMIPCKKVESAA